jgi:hypothetical protein
MGHVNDVLAVLHKHHFQLNPPKCEFFKPMMNYLGHTIDAKGMRPLDYKIETIKQFPMPTTLREANYFIEALGFYRKFIKNFAQMAAPIHRITNLHKQQRREFNWGPEQMNAFHQLKLAISTKPLVLDFPIDASPLILSTDASDIGIGGVLKQTTPDGIRVRDRILSKILGTFCTLYLKISSTSKNFSVQVNVLVLRNCTCILVLSTNLLKYSTISTKCTLTVF